jgi:hypothetical protein
MAGCGPLTIILQKAVNTLGKNLSESTLSRVEKTHEKMLAISNHKENANQNHTKIPSHPLEYPSSKTPTTCVGEDVGKKEPQSTAGGNASWCNHSGKKIWRLLKNLNIDLPYDPAIPLLGIYPKKYNTDYSRGTCTHMFIAPLFTIAKLWKQPRCPTTDEWIKKMWYLYTVEFYSAMKKNEILSFAGKWMELENIILSEVSQAQRTKNRMFSLICRL